MTEKSSYECRQHYEAALDGLAKLAGADQRQVRESFKKFLIREGVIGKSTTEMAPEQLDRFGDAIGWYAWRIENTPPPERGMIDFAVILNRFWDQLSQDL